MHSSFETHLIKKEELTTEVSALLDHPSHGIKHNDGRLSGLGGLRDDEPEPLIESTTSVLLSTKTAPGHDDPPGIFDDADEDDSFDLAAIKKLPPRAAPSSRSLRPDLVAAILGSAPKQFLAPAPVAAPPLDKPGHKKKKLAAKKVLRARKEIEGASKLLKGKIDLMKVLPERDCRFLAQNLWIFTLDQLEAVLNATDGKELDVCSELIAILKDSVLLNEGDKDHQDLFQVSSNEHALRSDFYDKCPVDRINVDDDAVDSIPGRQSFDGHNNETNDSAKGLCMKTEGSKSTNSEDQVSKKVSDTNGAEAERLDIGEDPIVASKMSVDELMQSWRKKIQDFDQLCETDETSRFSLDGPLSCLIPKSTQNFLKSAGIVSAREFLSLKKTESGLVVDIYVSWRKKCGMEEIPCVTIAKHLLAIGTRLEVAIESSAISKEVREWVGGHTIVLSGQGKDFLFDHCKLYNADEFIERRTKELADRLRDWRDSKGLPPLKGTGKVAMISAWKTLVKEAKELESHDGRVLKTEDLMAELEEDISAAIVPKNTVPKPVDASVEKKRRAKKSDIVTPLSEQVVLPPMNSGSPKGQTVLESQGLLSDILKKEIVVMLASNGITSAKELLYAGKQADSRLISAVMRMRKDFSGDSSTSDNAEGCIRLVREWCQQVEQRQGVASPDKHASPEWQTTLDRSYTEKKFPDPWDALSQASKDFLTSIDIKDAESFLAAKTKNLAESFTIYREKNGMAPLKGLGSVASISGWKAIVRKAAKDAGQDRLVTLNAGRNAGIKLNRRAKEETKESQPQSLQQGYQEVSISKVRPSETSDRGGIHGISKNKFWVANGKCSLPCVFSCIICRAVSQDDEWK